MTGVLMCVLLALAVTATMPGESAHWALSVQRAQPGEGSVAQESQFWIELRNTSSSDRVVCLESILWGAETPTHGIGGSILTIGPHHPCDNFAARQKVKAGQSLMIPASIPTENARPSFDLQALDLGPSGDLSRLTRFEVSCEEEPAVREAGVERSGQQ